MYKYVFISDFFQEIGGGEMVDARLREFLAIGADALPAPAQILIRCADCTPEKLSQLKDNRFIISNFIALSEDCKQFLAKNCNYIIWEHDHKYLKTRNPSVFKDWKAPAEQLQNIAFYQAAKSVICQTQQHLDVVFKNTGLDNLVNYGGSLWSNKQLEYLRNLPKKSLEFKQMVGILDSEIVHKGTRQAIEYCKSKNIEYKLLPIQDWKDFIKDLEDCTDLLFFPQVLETCSRIAVEARMLGLKVIGNNNLSALKEDWFKKYKGVELVEYFIEKNKNIQKFIDTCFWPIKVEKIQEADVTVILNLYKRPQNLQKQIEAFKNQTVKPKEIWIWQNDSNIEGKTPESYVEAFQNDIKWITSNHNWGIFGRFTMAQMVKTKFVCINDDDTIPGPQWLETCLESFRTNPGLQGGIGVRLEADNYRNHHRIGWAEPRPSTEEVDLVGHSWFFPKEYLKYIWMEEPFTWNMEDAHFSYCLQKYGNIKTFVPPQFGDKSSSVLGYELGVDDNAMSHPKNHEKFYKERDEAINYYLKNGWKRVLQ